MTFNPLSAIPLTWQLSAVSMAVAVLLATSLGLVASWLWRRRPAPTQYGLLLSVLVLCLAAPLLTHIAQFSGLGQVEVTVPVAESVTPQSMTVSATTDNVVNPALEGMQRQGVNSIHPTSPLLQQRTAFSWSRVGTGLLALWAIGVGVALLRIGIGWALVRRLVRASQPVSDATTNAAINRARMVLGLNVAPALRESSMTPTPMVVGLIRPMILLPSGLSDRLDVEQLDAVLLHETAHIAHRDPVVGLLQRLAAALFWWCPLLHIVNRRINDLREDICDNYVIQVQGDGFRLAKVLVTLAEQATSIRWLRLAGAMAVTEPGKGGLEARVKRLLQGDRNTVTRMNLVATCATAVFALLVGGVMVATTVRAAENKQEPDANAAKPKPIYHGVEVDGGRARVVTQASRRLSFSPGQEEAWRAIERIPSAVAAVDNPELTAPKLAMAFTKQAKGTPLHDPWIVVLAPTLDASDQASITELVQRGNRLEMKGGYTRANLGRGTDKSVPWRPIIAVPLPESIGPGAYHLTVTWECVGQPGPSVKQPAPLVNECDFTFANTRKPAGQPLLRVERSAGGGFKVTIQGPDKDQPGKTFTQELIVAPGAWGKMTIGRAEGAHTSIFEAMVEEKAGQVQLSYRLSLLAQDGIHEWQERNRTIQLDMRLEAANVPEPVSKE